VRAGSPARAARVRAVRPVSPCSSAARTRFAGPDGARASGCAAATRCSLLGGDLAHVFASLGGSRGDRGFPGPLSRTDRVSQEWVGPRQPVRTWFGGRGGSGLGVRRRACAPGRWPPDSGGRSWARGPTRPAARWSPAVAGRRCRWRSQRRRTRARMRRLGLGVPPRVSGCTLRADRGSSLLLLHGNRRNTPGLPRVGVGLHARPRRRRRLRPPVVTLRRNRRREPAGPPDPGPETPPRTSRPSSTTSGKPSATPPGPPNRTRERSDFDRC
jgi:hypothetical protein